MRKLKRRIGKLIKRVDEILSPGYLKIFSDTPALITFLFHGIFSNRREIEQNVVLPQEGITKGHFIQFIRYFLKNVNSINMQLTYLGTESVIKAIEKYESGEVLKFIQPDYSSGFLSLKRHWSAYLKKQVQYIEKNKLIEQMLKKPARKQKLPIVKL